MKFSIITPTLNAEAVIETAIRSVLQQDFKDYEHLVIDGQSTDGTLDILRKYPHLVGTSEADQGIYDAMNKGLSQVRGEWIYFLGADDELATPDTLSRVNEALLANDDVVYGDVVFQSSGQLFDGAFDFRKIYHHNICQQAIFYRTDVFQRIGNFSLSYKLLADWEHNLRWFFDPEVAHRHVDLVVANYCDGGASWTSRDERFYRARRYLYLRHAGGQIPIWFALRIMGEGVISSTLKGDLGMTRKVVEAGTRCLSRAFQA